jgi:hypothetical protein
VNRTTFCWIFALGLSVRIAAAFVLAPSADSLLASAHHEHASIAKNLAEGRGFRFNFFGDIDHPDLTSQQAPFVPGLIAAAYRLFGVETPSAFWFVVALQIAAGAFMGVAVADASWRWSGEARLGWIAGAIAAFYPPFVVASLHLQALPWNLCWIALMLSGAARISTSGRGGGLLLAVGGIGGLYTDPILAMVLASLVGCVLLKRDVLQARIALAVSLAIAVAVAPWIARNDEVHGRFEFIKNSFPYVFWQGNTLHSAGTDKLILSDAEAAALRQAPVSSAIATAEATRKKSVSVNDVALTVDDLHELAALPNETTRMDWFGRRIRAELMANPWHYPRMCAVRLQQWVWFDETNPKSFVAAYRFSYLVLAIGALAGMLINQRRFLPVLSAAVALSAVHVLVITSARFRICLELLLVPYFAASVAVVISAVSHRVSVRVKQISQTPDFPISP